MRKHPDGAGDCCGFLLLQQPGCCSRPLPQWTRRSELWCALWYVVSAFVKPVPVPAEAAALQLGTGGGKPQAVPCERLLGSAPAPHTG